MSLIALVIAGAGMHSSDNFICAADAGLYSFDSLFVLQMLGMHGTVFANFAVDEADLLLAFGVRFDDRVTGKLETFASKARVVHIDIDPAEISKNKEAHVMVCSDTRPAIKGQLLGGHVHVLLCSVWNCLGLVFMLQLPPARKCLCSDLL